MQYKIAVIISQFNHQITSLMEKNALERLKELAIIADVYHVPGAIEIPVVAKKLAAQARFDAIITLGAVVRGETSHYDYVCQSVTYGCQKIALKHMIPVLFGVLTCENDEQAYDRIGGKMGNKPRDMVDSAVEMINLMRKIDAEQV